MVAREQGWHPPADPAQTLGGPARRDPISGTTHVPKRTRLRTVAHENGWNFRYRAGDYEFTKDNSVLHVRFYGDLITSGVLFRDTTVRERGLDVSGEKVWDVLRGVECICPSFTQARWTRGLDPKVDPACPIHKSDLQGAPMTQFVRRNGHTVALTCNCYELVRTAPCPLEIHEGVE